VLNILSLADLQIRILNLLIKKLQTVLMLLPQQKLHWDQMLRMRTFNVSKKWLRNGTQ
jgi:hypothetical protein